MRIANLSGRLTLLRDDGAVDVEQASEGHFSADPTAAWARWTEFAKWAASFDGGAASAYSSDDLLAPVPQPGQVFAIGLNYADHASEAKLDVPENPVVFTKYPSSIVGPEVVVTLSGDRVDWEAELVVVIGTGGRDIAENEAWDAIAGLTVGQDLSDRTVQRWGKPAQFSLGKSFAGYGPIGPAVVTVDEIRAAHDPDALGIRCEISEEDGGTRTLQDGNTASLLFPIRQLIARLSAIVELRPGDLIFTGTPAGVGLGRDPQEFLSAGQMLTTSIEGLGTIRQRFIE